jgi:hypothetical protein
MATIYYEITYGDDPFIVRLTGQGKDITETKYSVGTYYFTGLEDDGTYVITITSFTGCIVEIEVPVICATTTTTSTTCYVYAEMVSFCEEIVPTTTTTTTSDPQSTIECLEGLVIEAIYIHLEEDYLLLSPDYVHPCPRNIGTHYCDRALFEVFGDSAKNIYIGDLKMNNAQGVGGGITDNSGNVICQDYYNRPDDLTGGTWTGSSLCRYDKLTLTYQQALDIATANPGGGNIVTFSLVPTVITYGVTCSDDDGSHENITWIRISKSTGEVIYNGCPSGEFLSLDVCTGVPVGTTTTTTIMSGLETVFIHIPNIVV